MSQAPSDLADGVPFSFFSSLLREISKAPSHKIAAGHSYRKPNYPALNIFRRWTNKLRKDFSPLPPRTTEIVFKLLYPNEDHQRKFDMQETRLSHNIAETFGINKTHLDEWLSENASGCLGEELRLVLEKTCTTVGGHISPLSVAQVDELLDELASTSGYTHDSIRKKYPASTRRTRLSIIKDLFRTLSPIDAGFLTQIILKDLRPILYPLRETHYMASLLNENTTSVHMLSKEDAMDIWDPSKWMLNSYRVNATIIETAKRFELPPNERERNVPKTGVPVTWQIPKSEKGRSPRHALSYFRNSQQVWAETKYDGERAQIHVDVQPDRSTITIFSKSKRDSTLDRVAVHDIIYRALGLTRHGTNGKSRVKSSVVLDAEMVAFNDGDIDEFWKIRELVENTAIGIRKRKRPQFELHADSEESSMQSNYPDSQKLGLVFFDVLSLDSKPLLMTPYCQRREILERLIRVTPGECILAERTPVGVRGIAYNELSQVIALEKVFANAIATHQEGLVLKGEETKYHDFYMPWVKLKRDYIPGYGDTLDMVIVGAAWERERGRVLRVPPSTMTTFYIGGIENIEEVRRRPSCRPHLHVYFTVSYGLSRQQLEKINFLIRSAETLTYSPSMKTGNLKYTFNLLSGLPPPKFILKEPLLAELFGAGFTRAPQSEHYELRFPRVSKIHRQGERPWTEGIDLDELHNVACAAIGRDSSSKKARDDSAAIWGLPSSPNAKSASKREALYAMWKKKLVELDGRDSTSDSESRSSSPSPSPLRPVVRLDSPAPKIPCNEESRTTTSNSSQSRPHVSQPLGTMTNVLFNPTAGPSSAGPRSHNSKPIMPFSPPTTPSPHKRQKQQIQASLQTSQTSAQIPTSDLKNALVWFAKPRGESWASKSAVPRAQRMHSIEALLTGCGWCAQTLGPSWVEKGVVFVDDGTVGSREMARNVLELIAARLRDELPLGQTRKAIWIFDQKGWASSEQVPDRKALYEFQ